MGAQPQAWWKGPDGGPQPPPTRGPPIQGPNAGLPTHKPGGDLPTHKPGGGTPIHKPDGGAHPSTHPLGLMGALPWVWWHPPPPLLTHQSPLVWWRPPRPLPPPESDAALWHPGLMGVGAHAHRPRVWWGPTQSSSPSPRPDGVHQDPWLVDTFR